MHAPRAAVAAVAALALSGSAVADDRPRLGIGVGLSTFDFNLSMLANDFPAALPDAIYFPINLGTSFRLEPQFGMSVLDQDAGNNPSIQTTVLSAGVGGFWLLGIAPGFDLLVGGRVVRTWYTSRLKYDAPRGTQTTADGADMRLIAAVGGEYALHRRFSLGAEAQLQLIDFGRRSTSSGGAIPGGTGFATAGVLFARVYLF